MTPTLGEARLAIAEADRAGNVFMACQNYRFRAHARLMHDVIAANAIGLLVSVSIDCRRDMRLFSSVLWTLAGISVRCAAYGAIY